MELNVLSGTDITTTHLGFGCNNLLGNKTAREGGRLLQSAYEAGVRHFDVARYYGFGGAEAVVGEFAKGKRSEITIATKFGIQPPTPSGHGVAGALRKGAIACARRLVRFSPLIRDLARRNLKSVIKERQFDLATAEASLHTSLRELGTDYIDIYLLHECGPSDCSPGLLDFLDKARSSGKIRAYGIGTDIDYTEAICAESPDYTKIIQFNNNVFNLNTQRAIKFASFPSGRAWITHGAVGQFRNLIQRVLEDSDLAGACSEAVGLDCADSKNILALIVQQALLSNPNGIVLFRSESDSRIRSTILAATEPSLTEEQVTNFEWFVKRWGGDNARC